MCYDLLLDDDLPPFTGIHLVDSDTESETASETESSEEEDEDSVASPLAVLPSRSALSDLGLIADLFEKMLVNWSSFCRKSPLFGPKSPKSQISNVLAFRKNRKNT